ncbi:MAG: hypothetical protein ACK5X3_23445 [Pseudomonadota bacterium]
MGTSTGELRTSLGQNSYVSVGLVIALVTGAVLFGRQIQRLDAIEQRIADLSTEVREMRRDVRQPVPGR